MIMIISSSILFWKSYRSCLFSETSPASSKIYLLKFVLSTLNTFLYFLLFIVSLFTNPSVLLTFEALGYLILCGIGTILVKKEYKDTGKSSKFLKIFWLELSLVQLLNSLLVGIFENQKYFPLYIVIDFFHVTTAVFMILAKEKVNERLLDYDKVWTRFESVASESFKPKKIKLWNNIHNISIPTFVIDEENTIYFKIHVFKGKNGKVFDELKRMAVEFNSLYEDFKKRYTKLKPPNFPPKVPQR